MLFNHILDTEVTIAPEDYFEVNRAVYSVGAGSITSITEYDGKYVAAYGGSGPLLSSTSTSTDFALWKHYPNEGLSAAPSKLLTDGTVLLSDVGGSILVARSMEDDLSYDLYPPPQAEITGWEDLALHDGILYALKEDGLYSSSNYGASWTAIDGNYQNCQALEVDARGIYLVQGGELLVRGAADKTWRAPGYTGVTAIHTNGERAFLSLENVIYYSEDGFQTFTSITTSATFSLLYSRGDQLLASRDQNVLLVTISTKTQKEIGPLGQSGSKKFAEINDLFIASNGVYIISTRGGFWVSSDAGETWKREIHFSGFLASGARAFLVTDTENTIYVVTSSGEVLSKENGFSWIKLNLNPKLSGYDCHSLFSFEDDIYVSNGSYLSYTTNDGESWTDSAELPHEGRHFATDDGSIYTATSQGVYKTDDKGASWTSTGNTVDVKKVFYADPFLYALSDKRVDISDDGGGTWVTDRLPVISSDNSADYYTTIGQLGETIYIGKGNEILSSSDGFSSYQLVSNARGAVGFLNFDGLLWLKSKMDNAAESLGQILKEKNEYIPITMQDKGGFTGDLPVPQTDVTMAIQGRHIWIADEENTHFAEVIRPSSLF